MTHRFVLIILLVFLISCTSKPDETTASESATPGGAIKGIVRETGTDQPIAGADVFVVRPKDQPQLRTTTDGDGRFVLAGLDPGRHVVALTKDGYVLADRLESSGFTFRLTDNQRVDNVTFHLTPAGSISGRVLNPDGKPAKKVEIQLIQNRYIIGRLQLTTVTPSGSRGRIETNEHGEFRVVGVDPGQYFIRLNPREVTIESVMPGGKPPVPMIYPGVRDIADAKVIDVKPAKETLLDEMKLTAAQRGWIRVFVVDQTGENLEGFGSWHIEPPGWIGSDYPLFQQRVVNSSHDFQPDLFGTYDVLASWSTAKGMFVGKLRVEYQGADVDKKLVLRKAGGRVSGQVMLEEAAGVALRPLPDVELAIGPDIPYFSKSGADGKFEFPPVYEGPYKFGFVRGAPPESYVLSVRHGNRDVLRSDLVVQNGETMLEVVVGAHGGRVEGKITNSAGMAVHNAIVALVPESPLKERTDYYGPYQNTRSDQNGEFELSGTTPGPYQAFAWSDVPAGAFRNEEFMKKFAGKGTPVKVDAGGRVAVELKALETTP